LHQRLALELANPLGGHAELPPGLPERGGLLPVDAVAELDDLLLDVGEPLERALERLAPEADVELLLGGVRLARQQLAEARLLLLANGPVDARHDAGHLVHL